MATTACRMIYLSKKLEELKKTIDEGNVVQQQLTVKKQELFDNDDYFWLR